MASGELKSEAAWSAGGDLMALRLPPFKLKFLDRLISPKESQGEVVLSGKHTVPSEPVSGSRETKSGSASNQDLVGGR